MRIDRLTKLAELLDTVPQERFHMNYWGRFPDEGVAPPELDISKCGTTACALGWACSIPEFHEAGLRLELQRRTYTPHYEVKFYTTSDLFPTSKVAYDGYTAASKFFGISPDSAYWLFSPARYVPEGWDEDKDAFDFRSVTPANVAARIRRLIAEGGKHAD